ncbi:unnamed protein product [Withania somnifera]
MAFAKMLQFCNNNYAELSACHFAILWCTSNNYRNIILELDSLLVVEMIQGNKKAPWNLHHQVQKIQDLIRSEANSVADILAKHGSRLREHEEAFFSKFSDLPREARRYFNMDKMELPSFRIRHAKRQNPNP